jgi:hypothetical protein
MPQDQYRSRAGRQVRAVGHRASGGHSPYRMHHEPNALDPLHPTHHHKDRQMDIVEYPKWLHFPEEPSQLVQDADEEAAVLAAKAKTKRSKKTDDADPVQA